MYYSQLGMLIKIIPTVAMIATALVFSFSASRIELPTSLPTQQLAPLFCYDLNMNGICDLATEDTNHDGKCDVEDCRGSKGDPGAPGQIVNPNILCNVTSDCYSGATCTINVCLSGVCHYSLPNGSCMTDTQCPTTHTCIDCACVETCNATQCVSDACVTRHCNLGNCEELTREDGCCPSDDHDCLGVHQVYYFMSGVFTDRIDSKTPNSSVTIEGVEMNNGSLTVPGGFYSYMPIVANAGISVDSISEYTPGNGINVGGVILKSNTITVGSLTLTSSFSSDSISSSTSNTDLTLSGAGTGVVAISDALKVDTINEYTTSNGVNIATVGLKSGVVTSTSVTTDAIVSKTSNGDLGLSGAGTGVVAISDALKVDTINEYTVSNGVNIASVLHSGGVVTATSAAIDTITSKTSNGNLNLNGAGTGVVAISDSLNVDTINGYTVSTSLSVGGVTLSSGGATFANGATSLNYYFSTLLSNVVIGGIASSHTTNVTITRIGNVVTMAWQTSLITASCTAGALMTFPSATVPSTCLGFSISRKIYHPYVAYDNGNTIVSQLAISSVGSVTFYAGNLPGSGGFSCGTSSNTGLLGGAVTWIYSMA